MDTPAAGRVSNVFAEALRVDRDVLNGMFAQYRMSGQEIDADELFNHLAESVDPVVTRVHEIMPERVRLVVRELYGASLSLFASSLLGSTAKIGEIREVFDRLLGVVPEHLARDPERLVASCCNAAYNLASQQGADINTWLDRLIEIAPACRDVSTLLDCGQVLAWQAGMAQYRLGALETAGRLPTELSCKLMDLPPDTNQSQIENVVNTLLHDAWQTPKRVLSGESTPTIQCVATVGAFRGFDGVFRRPPTVSCSDIGLCVTDGSDHWDLIADLYGSVLNRIHPRNPQAPVNGSPTVFANGQVTWGNDEAQFPMLAKPTSRAFDGNTLAVTIASSHHVFLLARV